MASSLTLFLSLSPSLPLSLTHTLSPFLSLSFPPSASPLSSSHCRDTYSLLGVVGGGGGARPVLCGEGGATQTSPSLPRLDEQLEADGEEPERVEQSGGAQLQGLG